MREPNGAWNHGKQQPSIEKIDYKLYMTSLKKIRVICDVENNHRSKSSRKSINQASRSQIKYVQIN